MDDKDRIKEYLKRERAGAKEQDAFEEWIAGSGTDPDVSSSLYDAFIKTEEGLPGEEQITDSFNRLLQDLGGSFESFRKKYDRTRRLGIIALVNGVAAVLAVLFGLWGWLGRTPAPQQELTADSGWTELYVPYGSSDSLALDDGTRLYLSAGTRITYPRRFDPRMPTREVFLDGEAFAQVSRNPQCPFVIHSHLSTVTVRGTTFRYKNYQEEDGLSLILENGSVEMEVVSGGQARKMELVPGNSLRFDKASGDITITDIDTALLQAARGNSLQFYDCSLKEIALALERKFGVRIYIESPELARVRYYTYLSGEEDDPAKILRAMDGEGHMKIERNNHIITISKRK